MSTTNKLSKVRQSDSTSLINKYEHMSEEGSNPDFSNISHTKSSHEMSSRSASPTKYIANQDILKEDIADRKKRFLVDLDDSFDLFLPNKPFQKALPATVSSQLVKRKSPYFDDYSSSSSHTSSKEYDNDLDLAIALSECNQQVNNLTNKHGTISPQKKCRTKKLCSVPLLLRRTDLEREKIITEKVAIVLMDNNTCNNASEPFTIHNENSLSEHLQAEVDQAQKENDDDLSETHTLVNISGEDEKHQGVFEDNVNEADTNFKSYDETRKSEENKINEIGSSIKCYVDETGKSESKMLSQCSSERTIEYPCSFNSDSINYDIHDEEMDDCSEDKRLSDIRTSVWTEHVNNFKDKIQFEIKSLKLLSDDFEKLLEINDSFKIVVQCMDNQQFVVQSYILSIRCPKILFDVKDNVLSWETYPSSIVRSFFKYILSGKIDQFFSLIKEEQSILTKLAKFYELGFLEELMKYISTLGNTKTQEIKTESIVVNSDENICSNFDDSNSSNSAMEEFKMAQQSRQFYFNEQSKHLLNDKEIGSHKPKIMNSSHLILEQSTAKDYSTTHDQINDIFFDSAIREELQHSFNSPVAGPSRDVNIITLSSDSELSNVDDEVIILDDNSRSSSNRSTPERTILSENVTPTKNYFRESFPSFGNTTTPEIIMLNSNKTTTNESSSSSVNNQTDRLYFTTPEGQDMYLSEEATPLPDYKRMSSSDLKIELTKYGLKENLKKLKAAILLKYIYDKTHLQKDDPLVKDNIPLLIAARNRTNSDKGFTVLNSSDSKSNHSIPSNINGIMGVNPDSIQQDNLNMNEASGSDLRSTVAQFIKSNEELYTGLLLYKPIWFSKFYKMLNDHGIICLKKELLRVLDESGFVIRKN